MAEDGVDTLYGFGWHDGSKDRKATIDRCLVAMKEDVANWLSRILNEEIMVETLMEDLDTGVVLCRLANLIQRTGEEFLLHNCSIPRNSFPPCGVTFKERTAFRGSFIARDNVANFIRWCRELGVPDILMFETEDLVLHKNEKSVILTLMDVARLSVKFGFDPPDLVKMENEIDREIEQQPENVVEMPMARLKKKHKSHSLDDLVYQVLDQCTCPVRYPVLRIAEGKYRVGENKSLIFVRVMRKHVMVRVGGGWDTLERYFDKHDPCKISERQRRNSIKSPRSRSGSDAIGRSPSTMSMSSTDSHDSTGSSVTHGRSASWNPSQGSSSQLKSPPEDARRTSPSRSPTPDSPRRTRRGMTSRDTPPRTIQTQSRGRLARKSKSMQELSSFVEVSRAVPSYCKPTSSSIRKLSQSGPEKSPTGTTGESRRNSSVTSARKTSASPREALSAKERLSSSGPVGSQKSPPMRVSRSASFGSRPRPMGPQVEPRARAAVPKGETQRRTSMANPRKTERSDGPRPRESSATRRSSTTLNDSKGKLPGSPKPGSKSVSHDKQERNRKPSVTRISSTQPKIEPTRKLSKGTPNQATSKKSLPSSSGNQKTSTSQPNVASSAPVKGRVKQDDNVKTMCKGNTSKGLIKVNGEKGGKVCSVDTNGKLKNGMENGTEVKETVEFVDLINGPTCQEDSRPINASLNLEERNISEEETNDISFAVSVSSPDGRYSEISANERKASQGSLETESDLMSDMLSDFTDTDYDIRSQRYSGISEASSDVSFGTNPAWRFLRSPDVERNIPEPCSAAASPELSPSPKVKDCLTNLNLQGSLTPTVKRRIFNEAPPESPQEGPSKSSTNSISYPVDKAKFFDVEKYKDLSEEQDYAPLGSPRKWSLVKSLISSIENRGVEAGKVSKVSKNTTAARRAEAERAGRQNQDDPAVARRNERNPETMETTHTSSFSFQEQNKSDAFENGHTITVMGQRSTGFYEEAPTLSDTTLSSYVIHDINSNIPNDLPKHSPEIPPNSWRDPGEKPYEAAFDTSQETIAKTRKISRDKRDRIKDLDVFPRPQRQFTLEEMIQDMMPPDDETKGTGEQRVTSPEPRFQAWL